MITVYVCTRRVCNVKTGIKMKPEESGWASWRR